MKIFTSKLGLILSSSYLGLFLLSGIYALYLLVFHTAESEFSGLLAILITSPWSLMWSSLMNSWGYISWYERFAGSPAIYGMFAMAGLLPPALLNAAVLYFIGAVLDNKNRKVL